MDDLLTTLRVLKHSNVELTNNEMFKLFRSYFYADEAAEMVNSAQIEWLLQTEQTVDVMYESLINQVQSKKREGDRIDVKGPWISKRELPNQIVDDIKHNDDGRNTLITSDSLTAMKSANGGPLVQQIVRSHVAPQMGIGTTSIHDTQNKINEEQDLAKHCVDPWSDKTAHIRVFWPPKIDKPLPDNWGVLPNYISSEYRERLKPFIIKEYINFNQGWGTPIAIARGKRDSISLRKIFYEMNTMIELFHGKKIAMDIHPNNGSEFWDNVEENPFCGCLLIIIRSDGKIPRGMI